VRSLALGSALVAFAVLFAACVVGSGDPGCRSDAECDEGFTCRAGACFRLTTGASPPADPSDAGDGG
jgi:hypothetical protein